MSRPPAQSSQASFASQTTWQALAIESGEDTEEEIIEESPAVAPTGESPAPLSKSAIKKAKALARAEKRQQEKAARAAAKKLANGKSASSGSPSIAQSLPESPTETSHPPLDPVDSTPVEGVHLKDNVNTVDSSGESSTETDGGAHPPLQPPQLKADPMKSSNPPVSAAAPQAVRDADKNITTAAPSQKQPYPAPSEKPAVVANRKENTKPASELKPNAQDASAQQAAEKSKKRQSFLTRMLWTFIMIGGFITLLLMGHAYMIVLVFMCQTLVYREVTTLFSLKRKDADEEANGRDPWSKTLNWYFFAVVNYFLYGESIIYYFKHVVFSDAQLTGFAMSHRFISFSLYTLGFMGFVMSLKRGYLKQQFGLFCWVHMTLLLVVVSSHFIVNNILEGMIWFWVPASLVICNDCFAYIWGITLGRTPLFKLSPKKTVEGFVGALFSTIIFGLVWGSIFMRFQYMICPVHDLGVSAWDGDVTCDPNLVFVWREWNIPKPLSVFLSTLLGGTIESIPYTTYHFHLFFLSCFASLVAPFGGFFASGFKRAFDIKDFGSSIPGHGGMTDRMDCQFLMGVFTYVYYSSLIRENHVTVGSVLQLIVSGMTVNEQLELMADLKRYLEGQGIIVKL